MSNTASGKQANLGDYAETGSGSAQSVECSEQPIQQEIAFSPLETVVPGQGDDHHVISTGNYYQAESRGFNYTDDEGQEWDSDGESGEL